VAPLPLPRSICQNPGNTAVLPSVADLRPLPLLLPTSSWPPLLLCLDKTTYEGNFQKDNLLLQIL
jgi:hypothetical protein